MHFDNHINIRRSISENKNSSNKKFEQKKQKNEGANKFEIKPFLVCALVRCRFN